MIKVPEKSTHKLNCSNELAYFSRPFTKEVYQLVKMKMTVDISLIFLFFFRYFSGDRTRTSCLAILRPYLYGLSYPRQLFPRGNYIERLHEKKLSLPASREVDPAYPLHDYF